MVAKVTIQHPMHTSNSLPHKIKNLAVIKVTGDDCLSFLQGQLSNDIEQLEKIMILAGKNRKSASPLRIVFGRINSFSGGAGFFKTTLACC